MQSFGKCFKTFTHARTHANTHAHRIELSCLVRWTEDKPVLNLLAHLRISVNFQNAFCFFQLIFEPIKPNFLQDGACCCLISSVIRNYGLEKNVYLV